MAQQTVENRIRQLEQRLSEVEHAPSKVEAFFAIPFKSSEDKARVIGWGCTSFALLGFLLGWASWAAIVGLLLSIVLIVGMSLVLAASGLIAKSDSHLQLAQEARSEKRLKAHDLHHQPKIAAFSEWLNVRPEYIALAIGFLLLSLVLGWSLASSTNDPLLQIMPAAFVLILIGVVAPLKGKRTYSLGAIIALTALLFVAPDPMTTLMAALAGFAVIWIAGWEKQDFDILSAAGLGLVIVSLGQTYWRMGVLGQPEAVAALSAAMMGLVLAVVPYAPARRHVERRDLSRITIAIMPVLAVSVITVVGPYSILENLLSGLLLIVIGYAALAYVGWLSHSRLSYAKYFLATALGALLLFAYLLLDSTSVTLIWFILGVVVTAGGFVIPSYSTRNAGLGLLAIGVLHYLLTMLNAPQIAGPLLLRDRVWLGLIIAMFLPALAIWYQESKFKGVEQRIVPVIAAALSSTSFLILFAIGYLDLGTPYQSISWLVIGALAIAFGRFTNLKLLVGGGIGLIGLSAIKLFGFDIFTLASSAQLLVLFGVAMLLILTGLFLAKQQGKRSI